MVSTNLPGTFNEIDLSYHLHLVNSKIYDLPEDPKRDENRSKEDYDKAVKTFFEVKGLKHTDDFSEDENSSFFG